MRLISSLNRLIRPFGMSLHRENPFADIVGCIANYVDPLNAGVIFDVGAASGQFSLECRARFTESKGWKIHAFEPQIEFATAIRKTFADDEKMTVHNCALGEENAEMELNINKSVATSSLLEKDSLASKFWQPNLYDTEEKRMIEVRTIDDVVSSNGLDKIDILKIDAQGFELSILNGGSKTLRDNGCDVILLEMLVVPTYKGQSSFPDLVIALYEFGFVFVNFFEPIYNGRRLSQFDGLFVHGSRL